MALSNQHGTTRVVAASKPEVPDAGPKGTAHVGSNVSLAPKSSGKMASVGKHVNLGTHHGKHNVAHAVNGKSMSGGKEY